MKHRFIYSPSTSRRHLWLFMLGGVLAVSIRAQNHCSDTTRTEQRMVEHGLVDVGRIDTTLRVRMAYASVHNFLKKNIYGHFCRCYLQPEIAKKLVNAQSLLIKNHPGLSLMLLDCARPSEAQWLMWQSVIGTEKQKYVANPKYGSIHSYGAAVDITLADSTGTPLDMGTPFDSFSRLSQPWQENYFFKHGRLSRSHLKNRQILRDTMKKAGFIPIRMEWWHFNGLSKKEIRKKFRRLN